MTTKVRNIEFAEDPIVQRHSHLYGEISLYPPKGAVEQWSEAAWLLQTLHGAEGRDSSPLRYEIRADAIQHCLNHTSLIMDTHLWRG
jgi:hypothetical protein